MITTISVALNEYRLGGTLEFLNVGSGVAHILIYDSARPANGAAITTETLLVDVPLLDPPGTVGSNKLSITTPPDALILASGIAAWARVINGDGSHAIDCDVTDIAGAGPIKMASTTLYAGGIARILSAEFS